MIARRTLLVAALALGGCDQLFPELTGADNFDDAATPFDGELDGVINGHVCGLPDLVVPSTCGAQAANVTVDVGETHATASTDASGDFTIALGGLSAGATLELTSANTNAIAYASTISFIPASTLSASRDDGLLLPMVEANTLTELQRAHDVTASATRGTVIAWIVGPDGKPVTGAVASATGALYDSGDGTFATGATTGAYGAVALLDVEPGTLSLQVTPPASAALVATTFSVPVEGGVVTVETLQLPAE